MDPETARLVVIGGTAVGSLVWLAALATLLLAARERRAMASDAAGRFDADGFAPSIVGEATVDGDAEPFSIKLAALLAREAAGPLGPVKIVARDRRELAFEAVGPSPLGFRRGRARFEAAGPRTRIGYALETSSRPAVLLGVGWAILGLGLVVLVAAPAWLLASVVPGQAFQVVQIGHVLWPPFLFAHLSRLPARMLRAHIEALIHNLPYS